MERYSYSDVELIRQLRDQVKALEQERDTLKGQVAKAGAVIEQEIACSADVQADLTRLQRDNRLLLEHITCARKVIGDREQERDALKGQVETFKKAAESSHAGHMDAVHYADILQADLTRLRQALISIANNTCCGSCQEAALVAKQALSPAQPGQGGGA